MNRWIMTRFWITLVSLDHSRRGSFSGFHLSPQPPAWPLWPLPSQVHGDDITEEDSDVTEKVTNDVTKTKVLIIKTSPTMRIIGYCWRFLR